MTDVKRSEAAFGLVKLQSMKVPADEVPEIVPKKKSRVLGSFVDVVSSGQIPHTVEARPRKKPIVNPHLQLEPFTETESDDDSIMSLLSSKDEMESDFGSQITASTYRLVIAQHEIKERMNKIKYHEELRSLKQRNKDLEERIEKLEESRRRLEQNCKDLEDINKKQEKNLNQVTESKEAIRKDLDDKNCLVIALENKLKRYEILIQSYELRVKSAIHSLSQPFLETHVFDMLDVKVKPEIDVNSTSVPQDSEKNKPTISEDMETSSGSSKHKISDRQNRRWTNSENVTILEYILKTIRSGSKIEKPNAPKYYTKMISECKLSPEITHNLLRNKVQNFRRAFEKARKENTECSYQNYLEEIWGNRSYDSSSE
ncbi:unnamed protein product [Allacma fusca]|uniref:Uncharacterized protein n=1 Tax=Allacma fusca TaxID=39272 RepID=A0A8J2P150_9HEXA|nr:unnamed protein product [Allacma fusca]